MIDVITDIRIAGVTREAGGCWGGLDVGDLESVDVLRSPPHILPGYR